MPGRSPPRRAWRRDRTALRQKHGADAPRAEKAAGRAALAYSVGYPFGVVGPILVIVVLRRLFGVDLVREKRELAAAEELRRPRREVVDFEVTEPAHAGISLREHPLIRLYGVVLSRLLRDGVVSVPGGDTEVRVGDVYRAIGAQPGLAGFVKAMGRPTTADFGTAQGDVRTNGTGRHANPSPSPILART